jgi:hypothetical protein
MAETGLAILIGVILVAYLMVRVARWWMQRP